jgi:hypothetical protein
MTPEPIRLAGTLSAAPGTGGHTGEVGESADSSG